MNFASTFLGVFLALTLFSLLVVQSCRSRLPFDGKGIDGFQRFQERQEQFRDRLRPFPRPSFPSPNSRENQ